MDVALASAHANGPQQPFRGHARVHVAPILAYCRMESAVSKEQRWPHIRTHLKTEEHAARATVQPAVLQAHLADGGCVDNGRGFFNCARRASAKQGRSQPASRRTVVDDDLICGGRMDIALASAHAEGARQPLRGHAQKRVSFLSCSACSASHLSRLVGRRRYSS